MRIAQVGEVLAEEGIVPREARQVHFVEHHRAHLASAFFASPFEEAAVVSIDGFGDFSSVMWGMGKGNQIEVRGSVSFPHSLGIFYTAFTQFLGFPKYGDEYKMMGLSAYGEPRFAEQVRRVVRTERDQCRLNLDYFTHHSKGVEMTWYGGEPVLGEVFSHKMVEEFGDPRAPRSEIQQKDMDLAASVQLVLEENYFALLNFVQKQTGATAVCLAGGVALNCVANGMIFERTNFRDVYIQPAAHDAGTSIGAALYVQHQELKLPRCFEMRHVYYGPEYSDGEILRDLEAAGCKYHKLAEDESDRPHGGGDCPRKDCGLVSGSHGVWTARAGEQKHSCGPAPQGYERDSQQPHQVSRAVSAVLPVDSRGEGGRIFRDGLPVAVHGDGVQDQAGATRADSGGDPRRWDGEAPDSGAAK